MTQETLLDRRTRLLGKHFPLFYDRPLHLLRGEGVWLYDADGRRYLDVYNNVPHVGHCHPRVVDALCTQARMLNIHTRYLHENIVNYAERLTATFDDDLKMALFCCSGTEANELALRIASKHTGGTGIIVSDHSYHGNSATLAALTTAFPTSEVKGPYIRTIRVPDPYRDGQTGDATAAEVATVIREMEAQGIKLAALLVDTLFSTEGLPNVPEGWLKSAVDHVHAAGGLFIADEVQPGFGRMGSHMWGYQAHGVTPDLVTMGKPMGNGHPLAGVVARGNLVNEFAAESMYFNTFGGNPVSAAVGLAVLDVIRDENLMENARAVGDYIQAGLHKLAANYDIIGDVRGRGLFFGLELVRDRTTREPAPRETSRIVNQMRENGVLISKIGRHENVLKMRPPMLFNREHADLLLSTLDRVIGSI
ncbi:aspartate aminotransferase family protein [Govanella unica]|uniref:Aminotransferase class III-fold pyridoxal phosphate-dependent enzyme n=1 Tax=Govanella unica TaxID=2975056 RepID=A0A9X3TWT3_9PROT|nr:aminotransferase class III-fold pyridoxal phosphate-dependent enzyme [Govania unica]MDA5193029.1 aminotransferase class III-fold pyridoxal phosphate-dependent enzyme [Govania unica]